MAQYISKSALLAEINKRITDAPINNIGHQRVWAYNDVKDILDTLEVKEVDLDFQTFAKEMDAVFDLPSSETKNTEEEPLNWEYAIAKHFFELGLSVSNPITAADRGTAKEIITNLKRVEKDYHISLAKEIEWLRNKVKKGE